MRWTKVLLTVALALGAAPTTASGAGSAGPLTQERRAAWLAERARLSEGLPFVTRYATAAGDDWGWYSELADAGDLDGDGKGDFLDLRSHLTYDDATGFTEEVRIDAYRGFDGKALWTRTLPPASFVFPVVAKVGVDGKQGVVVVAFTGAGDDTPAGGAGAYDTTITSYNGAGVPLWVRPLDGVWLDSLPGFAYADHFFEGFFDAVPGGGTDMLVQSVAMAAGGDPTGTVDARHGATQLSLLDGATGAVVPLGKPVTGDVSEIDPRPVGDLDKDRREDVLLAEASRSGVVRSGVSSSDGRTLWTSKPDERPHTSFVSLPDVTGDGAADFAAVSYSFRPPILVVAPGGPSAAAAPGAPGPNAVLYDGATGKTKWSKAGSRLFPLGDIDRKPGVEVAVGGPVPGSYAGFTVAAFTGSGKRLWSATRKVRSTDRYPGLRLSWGGGSDVHGDGVNDIGYALVGMAGKKVRRDEGTVNGRTGRVTRDPRPGMYLTRAALDGRGADGYVAGTARGVLTFDAWRGDAPSRMWSLAVRAPGRYDWTTAASVDGDKCGDVALATYGDAFTDVVVSGSTGKPLWVLTRSDGAAGKVSAPSVVRHTVYRKGC